MAIRSTSGTGVVVSLVVFVLCTVFLLILSIVFYAGKSDALQNEAVAKATLALYVSVDLQNRDQIKAILGDVKSRPGGIGGPISPEAGWRCHGLPLGQPRRRP